MVSLRSGKALQALSANSKSMARTKLVESNRRKKLDEEIPESNVGKKRKASETNEIKENVSVKRAAIFPAPKASEHRDMTAKSATAIALSKAIETVQKKGDIPIQKISAPGSSEGPERRHEQTNIPANDSATITASNAPKEYDGKENAPSGRPTAMTSPKVPETVKGKEEIPINEAVVATSTRSHQREHIERDRTPGRDGPIKETVPNCKPDIKPFKGEKGHKVRKSFGEKEEEYAQFCLENEGHAFHEIHVCHKKGPNGSPTYDKSGFQLDWHKVDNWKNPQPYNKARIVKGMEKAVDDAQTKEKRMKELFFEEGEAPADSDHSFPTCARQAWMDRVSKDLNVPWHKIGVEEFVKWDTMGFKKARRGEYETFSKEERARFLRLLSGASLRK